MKIVFLDAGTMGTSSLAPIESQGKLVAWPNSTPEESVARVSDCDVLIVNKIKVNDRLLDAAPRLRLVCEAGTGINNIDVDACERRGVLVRNVAGYSTDSVVQETFMHILNLLGNGAYFDEVVKSGAYSRSGLFTDYSRPFIEMAGKTLGVIGLGAIGSKVARIGTAFGMNHSTEYPSVHLERLMRESDVISVHAPYNERTAGLVGEKELRMMKPKAIIVNMGRGGIVVEDALAKVIDEGVIGGAGLDVYSVEPIPTDHPLLHTRHPERLSLTPHVAWASIEARERLIQSIADNIAKGF